MKFEDYLRIVVPKIGPNAAFDLSRDAQLRALQNVLIEKDIVTKDEIDAEIEKQFGESAQNIVKMPPIPKEPPSDASKQDNN